MSNLKLDLKRAKNEDIANYNNQISVVNERAREFYEKEQETWRVELAPLYELLATRDFKELTNLQAVNLSLRHRIQDSITKYLTRLSKENVKYKQSFGDRMEFYIDGFGYKTNNGEKIKMIERDLNERKHAVELLEAHIEHLKELRYCCDQIQYSVKNITALMSYIV